MKVLIKLAISPTMKANGLVKVEALITRGELFILLLRFIIVPTMFIICLHVEFLGRLFRGHRAFFFNFCML
jgi:hypothetical protein